MKKRILMFLVILAGGAAAAYVFVFQPFSPALQPAQLLPRESLMVLQVHHFSDSLAAIRSSPLGRRLAGIDWPRALAAMHADDDTIVRWRLIQQQMTDTVNSVWFQTLFGDSLTLAVLPVNPDDIDTRHPEQLAAALVCIVRPRQPARVLGSLTRMMARRASITTEMVDGVKLNQVVPDQGPSFYYVIKGKLAVAAIDPQTLVETARRVDHKTPSLAENDAFRQLTGILPTAQPAPYLGLLDLQAAVSMIQGLTHRAASTERMVELETSLSSLKGFSWAGFVGQAAGQRLGRHTMMVGIDRQAMSPQVAEMMAAAPQENETLAMMPADPLVCTWQSTYDLKAYWQNLQHTLKLGQRGTDELVQFKDAFREKVGVGLDEVLDAFGRQFGLVLNDIHTGGMLPIPDLALLAETRNPQTADRIISHLADELRLSLTTEAHGQTTITYAQLPFGDQLSPAFACKDGFCTISTSRTLLKTILDQPGQSGAGLNTNPAFQAVDHGLSDPGNQMAFAQLDRLNLKTRSLIQRAAALAALSASGREPETRFLIDQVLMPIMDGLQMFQTLGMHGVMEPDRFITDIYIRLAPPAPPSA